MPLSTHLWESFVAILFLIAGKMTLIGGLIWFMVVAATLGFDPPPWARLLQRWAGAVCLSGIVLSWVRLVSGPWVVTLLDLASLPLLGAVAFTHRHHGVRRRAVLSSAEPRHN